MHILYPRHRLISINNKVHLQLLLNVIILILFWIWTGEINLLLPKTTLRLTYKINWFKIRPKIQRKNVLNKMSIKINYPQSSISFLEHSALMSWGRTLLLFPIWVQGLATDKQI